MNKKLFESIELPWQNPSEWFLFLNLVEIYFQRRELVNPVVVEIGSYRNKQKPFYEVLGGIHIGIDKTAEFSVPDILGASHDPLTLKALKEKLGGRAVNLLFIDGHHTYEAVKADYHIYSPLVSGLIAFHDIFNTNPQWGSGVGRFWNELTTLSVGMEDKTFITIHSKEGYANYGIGLVIGG